MFAVNISIQKTVDASFHGNTSFGRVIPSNQTIIISVNHEFE